MLFASTSPFAGGTDYIPLITFSTTLAPPFASAQSLAVVPSGAGATRTNSCNGSPVKLSVEPVMAAVDRIGGEHGLQTVDRPIVNVPSFAERVSVERVALD